MHGLSTANQNSQGEEEREEDLKKGETPAFRDN
jgi:hypothetical protein